MTNLIIDPTRGLLALSPDGEEYAISVPAGFSANHCVLMVEPASMGNGDHDVRSAFLLEEGYEGLVTDAENIYDLVSESSNPFYHYAMPTEVLQYVHVLNSGAALELGGVFEITGIENPEFDSSWNRSTNSVMYFYPDVLVTDRHILKLDPSGYGEGSERLRILSSDHGIGTNVVSITLDSVFNRRIFSNDDGSPIEVIIRRGDGMESINENGDISWPRYESGNESGSLSDIINFNGHAVYAVQIAEDDGEYRGFMFDIFHPSPTATIEIPHPQNLPFEAEVSIHSSFKFFKSPDNKRLFVLSVVDTTLDVSQDENTFIVIHEVGYEQLYGPPTTRLREIYCETMGTVLGKLQPHTSGDLHPMNYLHYHEYGILSISDGDYWPSVEHMRVLEIVGDSDEITITDFAAADEIYYAAIQPNATVVVSADDQPY